MTARLRAIRRLRGLQHWLDPRPVRPFVVFPGRRALMVRIPKAASISIVRWFEEIGDHPKGSLTRPLPLAYRQRYTTFAFVRNPWARVASAWADKVERGGHSLGGLGDGNPSFGEFLWRLERCDLANADAHVRPQSVLLPSHRLDFLGRVESLDADMERLAQRLGAPAIRLGQLNRTGAGEHLHELYSPDLVEVVARLYAPDIELLGYSFDIGETISGYG